MSQLQPLPVFINEAAGADHGLVCGYQLGATKKPREISADSIVESLARHDVVTWSHFNLSDARAPVVARCPVFAECSARCSAGAR